MNSYLKYLGSDMKGPRATINLAAMSFLRGFET